MEPRDGALLLFALGILLVLNPVYLFPGGVPHEKSVTYRAEPVERLDPYASTVPWYAVLDCTSRVHHRECIQARAVGYNGTMRLDGTEFHLEDDEFGLYTDHEYVHFPEGYARPNATAANGTLVLSYEPRPTEQVMSEYAHPYSRLPPVGKRAVRNGSVTTTVRFQEFDDYEPPLDDYERFVERNGTFYAITYGPGPTRPVVPEWLFRLARVIGVLGGTVLAFVGASRHARLVDEDESGFGPYLDRR